MTLFEIIEVDPTPTAFTAATRHAYTLPLVRLPTTIGEMLPVPVPAIPPLVERQVAANPVIVLPPSLLGFANATLTPPITSVALTAVGTPGTSAGVTKLDESEPALTPTAFAAVTEQEYDLPFVKPFTRIGDATPVAVCEAPPLDEMH